MKLKIMRLFLFCLCFSVEMFGSESGQKKKIALMFLTIEELNQSSLWQEYLKGNEDKFNVYIHSKNPILDPFFSKYRIKKIVPTKWGHICVAVRNLIQEATKKEENYKFVLLSESCVPLVTPKRLYEELTKDDETYLLWTDPWWREDNPRTLQCFPQEYRKGNHTWFILNREHALICAEDEEFNEISNAYPVSDESYMSTLLNFHGKLQVSRRTLTFVDWTRSKKSRPYEFKEFNAADFQLLQRSKEEGYLFARKFSAEYPKSVLKKMIWGE